jgi:hypothetical protein
MVGDLMSSERTLINDIMVYLEEFVKWDLISFWVRVTVTRPVSFSVKG